MKPEERTRSAQLKAHAAGLKWSLQETGLFKIAMASRLKDRSNPRIHVYIEGDGHAFATRRRISKDPTPRNPTALSLAIHDTHPSVVYVARPCQYLSPEDLADCPPRYWSSHRYAQEVITATSHLLDKIAGSGGHEAARKFTLIGFSGGGTVAALLAAERDDVDRLITIAANLDHRAWTAFHKVTPLHGSVSIDSKVAQLAKVSQCHLFGQLDTIVPPHLANPLLSKLAEAARPGTVQWSTVANFDHSCCWTDGWPRALNECSAR